MNKDKIIAAVELIGQRKWQIVYPYEEAPRAIEIKVRNIRTYGKEQNVQVEVEPIDSNEPFWMYYSAAYYLTASVTTLPYCGIVVSALQRLSVPRRSSTEQDGTSR